MKPVKSNIAESSEACTPISSNCVIWQGPDVPCLSLCSGDSVTDVVYKLATMVCEITENAFDYTDIDIQCLLQESDTPPANREQFYQLIVDKLCEALQADDTPGGPDALYNLPECLQYVDGDGNTIIEVTLVEYVDIIANAVCDIYTTIDSIQTELSSLDARVTALEGLTPTGGSPLINITTQCASGPTPGAILPIQQAFFNLETKFCGLHAVLGTIAQLNATIQTECTDLDTAATLMDDQVLMQDIPGWVVSPSTLAENINNIWLTICDMRAKVIDCCGVIVQACAPISVTNVAVGSITNTGATVSWTPPSYGTGEAPTEYLVEVYNWVGGAQGSLALSPSQYVPFGTNSIALNTSTLMEDKDYLVKVTAIYNCGSAAPIQVVSNVKIALSALCLYVFDQAAGSTSATCNLNSYTKQNKFIYARLQDNSGNPVLNTGSTITVNVTMNITGCSGGTENIPLTIANGQHTAMATYVSFEKVLCGGVCTDLTRTIGCVQSISGTTVTLCAAGPDLCAAP
jgi:hypothetical protein